MESCVHPVSPAEGASSSIRNLNEDGTDSVMFPPQQASPQFSQQSSSNMYNGGNAMNLNPVNNMAASSMGQMSGQMSVTSMASGPSPGLPSMGPEQVNTY
ncbi:hypothetical protein F7725_028439 [Dissostichus mawsoni]|uniref:Uncharacterized protein n=1 Tax=Dissostichus mawsoni TaxID=36200 RepID=A0A7J5XFY0_DISMA|nr:hypothetical protein F7725_028439 [Dissostichus mawsoni]